MSAQSVSPMPSNPAVRTQPALSARPWWARVASGFLLACVVWVLVGQVATALFGPDYSFGSHTFRAVATCVLVFLAFVPLLLWEHTRPSDYGVVVGRDMLRALGLGAVSYLVPFLVASSIVLMLNLAQVEVSKDALAVAAQAVVLLLLVILYEAVPEELVFRGYLFRVLSERLPAWAVIVGQALLFCAFGAVIGAAGSFDRLLLFFFFSISLGYLRQVTGSVFATIGFHAVFQLIAQWLLGDQWGALRVHDPGQWFQLIALALAPFVLAPVVAAIVIRSREINAR
jgi:membrane protease YdiL (CAAX protease family)